MKNQIAALVFLVVGTFSFAGDGIPYFSILDPDNEQPKHLIATRALMELNAVLPLMVNKEALNNPNNNVYMSSNPNKGNNWISQTISVFGGGFNLAGINIKMNKFDLVKKTGWVDKKEWNLNADKTRNGLSIKYKF